MSKPINKMVLIDYDKQKLQTLVHKSKEYYKFSPNI